MLIRLEAPIKLIKQGKVYEYKAGDVISTGSFPEAEKLIKAQKDKGRVEK